ncbi:MAG: hypothetical protein R3B45_06090 [Bdellovibrionota bacterium]
MGNKITNIILVFMLSLLMPSACKKARYKIVNKPGTNESQETKEFTDQPQDEQRSPASFYFEATPGTTQPNKDIKISAHCETSLSHHIEWSLGDDSAKSEGTTITHSYAEIGSYDIVGTCVLEDGRRLQTQVRINIVDETNNNGQNPNQRPTQKSPIQKL